MRSVTLLAAWWLLVAAPGLAQETPPTPAPAPQDTPSDSPEAEDPSQGAESPTTEEQTEKPTGSSEQNGTPPVAGTKQDPSPGPAESTDAPVVSDATDGARPAPRPRVEAVHPASADELENSLRGLAEAYPSVVVLESLGRSASGHEILSLSLRLEGATPVGERPTLLVLDHQAPVSPGAEAIVAMAWSLAERVAVEPPLAELLERTVLVLAPALDPDRRVEGTPERAVRFERNFPSGWQPESVRLGAGSISLSEPETHATARFLTSRRSAAVVLGFASPAPARPPYAGSELPERDREVLVRLVSALDLPGRPPVVPWNELGSPGGSLFDFAFQACGMLPLALPLESLEERTPEALAGWYAEVEERVCTCLALLPRLDLRQEGLERLAADTWQLDLRLENAGLVPTLSARARARAPGADVKLEVGGAKLLATAQRGPEEVSYQNASFPAGGRATLAAGTLMGGEQRCLRLVIEGAAGATVRVTARSPWGGSAIVELVLP